MRISTNTQNLLAQRKFGNAAIKHDRTQFQLASGNRIYNSAVDPAGLAISETMRSKIVSMGQIERNINDGASLLQVAEGVLGNLQEINGRLRELAMQAATDTVGDSERVMAQREFSQLKQEISRLTTSAKFNGNHLLNGSDKKYDLQVGLNNKSNEDQISYNLKEVLASADNFGMDSVNITSKHGAQRALRPVDKMLDTLSRGRVKLGASGARLDSVLANLQVSKENLSDSNSKIRDTDIAKATAERAKQGLIKDAAGSMLVQTANNSAKALKLVG